MAERIAQDPHLEVLPNHAGPHYDNIQNLFINTGLTLEQAIQPLDDSWTQTHDEWAQAWDQQVLNDNNVAEEAQHLLQEKMNDFEETTMVSSYIAP
jgi:hypothetical protein